MAPSSPLGVVKSSVQLRNLHPHWVKVQCQPSSSTQTLQQPAMECAGSLQCSRVTWASPQQQLPPQPTRSSTLQTAGFWERSTAQPAKTAAAIICSWTPAFCHLNHLLFLLACFPLPTKSRKQSGSQEIPHFICYSRLQPLCYAATQQLGVISDPLTKGSFRFLKQKV